VQGANAVAAFQHAVNEPLPRAAGQVEQRDSAAEVRILLGVTSRALQWTFARNFDGERGRLAF
jgi:hypothetical protein